MEKSFNVLKEHPVYSRYLDLIEDNLIANLIQRMGKLYKSMSFSTFKRYIGFLDFKKCEKFLFYSSSRGLCNVKVDLEKDMLLFNHNQEAGEGINSTLVDFFNNLSTVETSINRILMKNNRDWDKQVKKSSLIARNYLEDADESLQAVKERIVLNQ